MRVCVRVCVCLCVCLCVCVHLSGGTDSHMNTSPRMGSRPLAPPCPHFIDGKAPSLAHPVEICMNRSGGPHRSPQHQFLPARHQPLSGWAGPSCSLRSPHQSTGHWGCAHQAAATPREPQWSPGSALRGCGSRGSEPGPAQGPPSSLVGLQALRLSFPSFSSAVFASPSCPTPSLSPRVCISGVGKSGSYMRGPLCLCFGLGCLSF